MTDTTQPPAETLAEAQEIAIHFALPGMYDGISTHATRRGDADDKPYMRAILAALTRRAGGDDRQWPDIGEDPMKAAPYEDRMAVSAAAIRKAYTVQQPIVPDQTALVWRWHLGALLEAEIRLRSILARDDYSGDPDGDEPASAGGDAIHTDDLAVDLFAARMKAKLAVARAKGRGGWDDPAQCSTDYLCDLLHDHVRKGDPVDVANFCMMLDHYGASTTPKPPAGGDAGAVRVAAEALLQAMTIRALRGRDHVPSMREEQKAQSALAAALALPTPVVEGDVDKLRGALRDLEAACDDLAANRSRETYLNMIHCDRATPYLEALDEARRNARAALSEGRSHG